MLIRNTLLALAFSICSFSATAADSPMTVDGSTTVDATQAKALFDDEVLFVDPRKDSDWEAGRVPGAVHLELKSNFTQESLAAEAKVEEKIVFYCNGASCLRASACSKKAVSWGYKNAYYFRDGFPAWKAAGYPVE